MDHVYTSTKTHRERGLAVCESPLDHHLSPALRQPEVQRDEQDMPEAHTSNRERPTYSQVYRAYETNRSTLLQTREDLEKVVAVARARERELLVERDNARLLQEQLHVLTVKLAERENALRQEREKRLAAEDLLAKRTVELDAANALLPAAESITDSHIIELVQSVNYEVAQTATLLADAYEGRPRIKPSTRLLASLHPNALANIEECGAGRILQQHTQVDPTTALQIGLQATLVDIARIFLSTEAFSQFAGFDSVLQILKANEQDHVARHWYSLTHKYARQGMSDITDKELAGRIAMYLSEAIVLAGYEPTFEIQANAARVLSMAETQLVDIGRLLLDLDTILGEKVAKGWMESTTCRNGVPFEPGCMEAAFQGEVVLGEADVVCTTAFELVTCHAQVSLNFRMCPNINFAYRFASEKERRRDARRKRELSEPAWRARSCQGCGRRAGTAAASSRSGYAAAILLPPAMRAVHIETSIPL
ncbi:unnamed protein product [Peniophora sp. CBMAI 1063]|nr:unnamed protein product [Peniophora sp. CBMAI 1063]